MPDPTLLKLFATFFLGGFVSLVTIVNPLATIPFFTGLSGHMTDPRRRRWPAVPRPTAWRFC